MRSPRYIEYCGETALIVTNHEEFHVMVFDSDDSAIIGEYVGHIEEWQDFTMWAYENLSEGEADWARRAIATGVVYSMPSVVVDTCQSTLDRMIAAHRHERAFRISRWQSFCISMMVQRYPQVKEEFFAALRGLKL